MPLPIDVVQTHLLPYGFHFDENYCSKISIYIDLLTRWNKKIALTTVTTPEEILRFHFGESIFALGFCDFERGRLADVGSGPGFPGLAIKIFRPQLGVTLIEPSKKKSAFLAEVVRTLDLSDVEIISRSFEESAIPSNSLDYVTSRALAQTPEFMSWTAETLKDSGRLVLWISEESAARMRKVSSFIWDEPARIPGTSHRTILIGRKPREL